MNVVTPHKALKIEQNTPNQQGLPESFFIDWLSIYQSYPEQLPVINDGVVTGVNKDGQIVWRTQRGFKFQGSFDSSVSINCDGHTVKFSGNPSRFGRPDNVFGFDLATSLRRVNQIVGQLGLPPFTSGKRILRPAYQSSHNFASSVVTLESIKQLHLVNPPRVQLARHVSEAVVDVEWTGARFTRLDLTQNFMLGSADDARKYLQWLFTQQPSRRQLVGTYPDASTVDWGRGSRRLYAKFYLKFVELARRGLAHSPELLEWSEKVGLGRFELSLKSTQLQSMGCQFLGSLDMEQLELIFSEKSKILSRATLDVDDLDNLPNPLRLVARDYLANDLKKMPDSTFRRKRAALLPFGIDIAVPCNVHQLRPRVRVIELRPAAVPAFYQLHERLAA